MNDHRVTVSDMINYIYRWFGLALKNEKQVIDLFIKDNYGVSDLEILVDIQ